MASDINMMQSTLIPKLNKTVAVFGPTASGKSLFAAKIAAHFGGYVVNADSMQLYQDIPILTAQPTSDLYALAPHHLFATMPVHETGSVVKWYNMVQSVFEQQSAHSTYSLPILCGGTGLYLKVFAQGIAQIPDVLEHIRNEVRQKTESEGLEAMRIWLQQLDPHALEYGSDPHRTLRALEVILSTKKSLHLWHKESNRAMMDAQNKQCNNQSKIVLILLMPERDLLYHRINQRVNTMIKHGLLEEVARLLRTQSTSGYNFAAMRAIGLQIMAQYLMGYDTLDNAIATMQTQTRRYAKRQLTWINNQLDDVFDVFCILEQPPEGKFFDQFVDRLQQKLLK